MQNDPSSVSAMPATKLKQDYLDQAARRRLTFEQTALDGARPGPFELQLVCAADSLPTPNWSALHD
jgi:hypothetical protein